MRSLASTIWRSTNSDPARATRRRSRRVPLCTESLERRQTPTASSLAPFYVDPAPQLDSGFGADVVHLSNGNVVVSAPLQDVDGQVDAGAVYLFDAGSGKVLATLKGGNGGDRVGSGGVTMLPNGSYVVASPHWDNGTTEDAGAVTWRPGTISGTPVVETVKTSNSLHGTSAFDLVGISSTSEFNRWHPEYGWDWPEAPDLLTRSFDAVTTLPNGHYVVSAPWWDNGTTRNAGAVLLASGVDGSILTGGTGPGTAVSTNNSLHGTHVNDTVGSGFQDQGFNPTDLRRPEHEKVRLGARGVTIVSNPSARPGPTIAYVVSSPFWNNMAGAVTRVDGATGSVNSNTGSARASIGVGDDNSLHGDGYLDLVGAGGVTPLANAGIPTGSFVVASPMVRAGTSGAGVSVPGAVTWIDDRGRVHNADSKQTAGAVVHPSNSLFGFTASGGPTNSFIGSGGVVPLARGDYMVVSPDWDEEGGFYGEDAYGAVTYASGQVGQRGHVDRWNSLVGTTPTDHVGSGGVIAVPDGGCFVSSPSWSRPAVVDRSGKTVDPGAASVGAVTRFLPGGYVGNNAGGLQRGGVINPGTEQSQWNSLVGVTGSTGPYDLGDHVGSGGVTQVRVADTDYYAVSSPWWDLPTGAINPPIKHAGAVTLLRATGEVVVVDPVNPAILKVLPRGVTVDAANSLHGDQQGDRVGSGGVTPLAKGNFVVNSPAWRSGVAGGQSSTGGGTGGDGEAQPVDLGAVTWVGRLPNGAFRGIGSSANVIVGARNSLIGSTALDRVGSGGVVALATGHYAVVSPAWDRGKVPDVGAVTWGSGTTGAVGSVLGGTGRTLHGTSPGDRVGSGQSVFDHDFQTGRGGVTPLTDGSYVVASPLWFNPESRTSSGDPDGAKAGAVTRVGPDGLMSPLAASVHAQVSTTNSLVGSMKDDLVGSGGITTLAKGNYLVISPTWGFVSINGISFERGAITWVAGGAARGATVATATSTANSQFGRVTEAGIILDNRNGRFLVGLCEAEPSGGANNRVVAGLQTAGFPVPVAGTPQGLTASSTTRSTTAPTTTASGMSRNAVFAAFVAESDATLRSAVTAQPSTKVLPSRVLRR